MSEPRRPPTDYTPGQFRGLKNAVYWMATKRHNWRAAVVLVGYVAVVSVAVGFAVAQRGADSALPWLIGFAASGLMGLFVVVLIGLSLHWRFDLIPDQGGQAEAD